MNFDERFSNTQIDEEGKFKAGLEKAKGAVKAGFGKVKGAAISGGKKAKELGGKAWNATKSGAGKAGKFVKAHPYKTAGALAGAAALGAAGVYGAKKLKRNKTNEELIEALQYHNEVNLAGIKAGLKAGKDKFIAGAKNAKNKIVAGAKDVGKNTVQGAKTLGGAIKAHPYRTAAVVGGAGAAGYGAKKAYDHFKK